MSSQDAKLTASDGEYIERARTGDTNAFAELWRRHYRSAVLVARQFTSIDADDLVSEAYARIFQRVLAGGGPTGAFRPYLYTTIRNLASSWGAAARDVQVDIIDDFEDERIPADPAAWALDRALTATAFRSLPERWQTVLWYTEVEGMDPHEVAPIMGITANGVAALSYRAREGLRKAWLQAHISDSTVSGECRWAMSRIGDNARDGLGRREKARMLAHLRECAKCTVVAEEVEEVGSHLAMVMLPLLLGGAVGGSLLADLSQPASALAQVAIPALPPSVEAVATAGAALGAPVVGALSLGASSGTGALVGGVAVVAALGGGLAVGGLPVAVEDAPGTTSASDTSDAARDEGDVLPPEDDPTTEPDPVDPSHVEPVDGDGAPATGGTSTGGAATGGAGAGGTDADRDGGLIDDVLDTVTGDDAPEGHTAPGGVVGADIELDLLGTGTPGAHVSLQAAGVVYATTKVGDDGAFALNVTGLPEGLGSLKLVQTVDSGLLGGLLGGVVDLLKPLRITLLDSQGSGISVVPVG